MKLVVSPPALAELHDAAAFYALKANVDLGLAFVARVGDFSSAGSPTALSIGSPKKSFKSLQLHITSDVQATGHIGSSMPLSPPSVMPDPAVNRTGVWQAGYLER